MLCRQLGHERIGCGSVQSEHDRVTVRLRGMAELPEARDDVENFLSTVRVCAERYRKARVQQVYVTPEDVRAECGLAEIPALRALLSSARSLPEDPDARVAFECAAACVFRTSEQLLQLIAALGLSPGLNKAWKDARSVIHSPRLYS